MKRSAAVFVWATTTVAERDAAATTSAAANVRYTSATESPRRILKRAERRARADRAGARSAPRSGRGRACDRRPARTTQAKKSSSGSPTSWIQRGISIRGGGPAGALTASIVQRGARRRRSRPAGAGARRSSSRPERPAATDPVEAHRAGSGTVPAMSPPPASGRAAARSAVSGQTRGTAPRSSSSLVIAVVALGTLLVTAFGGGDHPTRRHRRAGERRAAPARRPARAARRSRGSARCTIELPVNQSRVTAIGYYARVRRGARARRRSARRPTRGCSSGSWHAIVGGGSGSPRWYLLPGGPGPSTSALDVGAAAGTDVYAPVERHDRRDRQGRSSTASVHGERIDIQPTRAPSLVVSVSDDRRRPLARRRRHRHRRQPRSSARCSTSRRSRRRRSRATRTTPATTSWSRSTRPRRSTAGDPAAALVRILFVGDVFGAPGRRAVEARLPGAARRARGRLLHRQRRERRRRARDHGEDRRAPPRRGRRRDHARQLGLGAAGVRAVPVRHRPGAAPGEPLARLARARASPSTTASP